MNDSGERGPAPAPPAGQGSWRHAVLGFVVVMVVLCTGFLYYSKHLYYAVDGGLALAQVANAPPATSVWNQSQISPLQGMGTQRLPGNPLINPGYAIFTRGRTLPLVVGSYLFFAGCLFLAVFSLGRALGIGVPTAVLAAQAACLLPFPPLEESAGFYQQLRLNPGVVYYIAIAIVLLGLLVRIGTTTRALNFALIAAIPALFIYSLLCDPIWTVVPYLSLWVFFIAALLIGRTRAALAWRGGAVLFGLAVLVSLSVPSYLWILLSYTARSRFRTEIIGEIQDCYYTFLPFQNARTAALFALLLLGTLLALAARERRVRLFAGACATHMTLMTAMTAVYLYTDINWTFPLPAYFQQAALPVYLLVAAAGWRAGWERLRERQPALRSRAARLLVRPALVVCLVPAVGAAVLAVKVVAEHAGLGGLSDNFVERAESGSSHQYFQTLRRTLVAGPGQPFNGSVATLITKNSGPVISSLQSALWLMGVPTLEEYSQLVSPQFYYLVTRGLGKPDDGPAGRNRVRVTVPRVGLLRALGVRFVLTAAANAAMFGDQRDCTLVGSDDRHLLLYELNNANVGTFSPVSPIVLRTARETLGLLLAPGVNLERDVVVTEPVAGPLVHASAATMQFAGGGVRISARSEGRTLLLLPLQYSHALRARSSRGPVQLVRANLAQTGLLFEREAEVFLSLDFGFGSVAGRAQDLADVKALGIQEDGTRPVDPASQMSLHPYLKVRLFGS